jgi:hypothetical protein
MEIVKQENIQKQIFSVRGVQVMLDSDLASIYQTETEINAIVVESIEKAFILYFSEIFLLKINYIKRGNLMRNFLQEMIARTRNK